MTEQSTENDALALRRLAEHLAYINGPLDYDCKAVTRGGEGRCVEQYSFLRWENGFADYVCKHHATTARARGAVVVALRRQDGTHRAIPPGKQDDC